MLTAVAAIAVAAWFVLLVVVRRAPRPWEDESFGELARHRQLVVAPPPPPVARAADTAVATLPSPRPPQPEQAPDLPRVGVTARALEEWRRTQLVAAGVPDRTAVDAARAGVDAASGARSSSAAARRTSRCGSS